MLADRVFGFLYEEKYTEMKQGKVAVILSVLLTFQHISCQKNKICPRQWEPDSSRSWMQAVMWGDFKQKNVVNLMSSSPSTIVLLLLSLESYINQDFRGLPSWKQHPFPLVRDRVCYLLMAIMWRDLKQTFSLSTSTMHGGSGSKSQHFITTSIWL